MRSLSAKRGFTLIELLVVIAIIAILASILFPVFAKAREKARQTSCMSKIRQIAVASLMYDQDNNGHFPGIATGSWDTALGAYLGNNAAMFNCPSDNSASTTANSYGYSGMLIQCNGTGVNESVITAPTEVGVVCDATPDKTFGAGGLVGNGGMQQDSLIAVLPAARHSNGTVVGYADGHAAYAPNGYNAKDLSNAVTRAFYLVNALGLINNPDGTIGQFQMPKVGDVSPITLGGDFCVSPILTAAADAYAVYSPGSTSYTRGFLGAGYSTGRPTVGGNPIGQGSGYAWGRSDGTGALLATDPAGATMTAVAQDAMVFIVSLNTKIPASYFTNQTNGVWVASTAQISYLFSYLDGYSANQFQAYTYDNNSGNLAYILGGSALGNSWPTGETNSVSICGTTMNNPMGNQAVIATDDQDMVNKVAEDPYGIGFCSSAMADTSRVMILGITNPNSTTVPPTPYLFPQSNPKYRWIMPSQASSLNWPTGLIRTLYVETYGATQDNGGGNSAVSDFRTMMLAPASAGMTALNAGALFQASYFPILN